MKLISTLSQIAIAILLLLVPTACFTGIESARKITDTDLRREKISSVAPEIPFEQSLAPLTPSNWFVGQPFLVANDKVKLIFSSAIELPEVGEKIFFAGTRKAVSVMGTETIDLLFVPEKNRADTLIYRFSGNTEDLEHRKSLEIPFIVDLHLVESAADSLIGKQVYILTPNWFDVESGRASLGKRFIPVTIVDVAAGNEDYPVKVIFKDSEGNRSSVLMTISSYGNSNRGFSKLFSFSNPKSRYPGISDENWDAIINSKVRIDMTRDEVRLSLGTPKEIDRGHNYSSAYERWFYSDGAYLLFEDGLLRSFRL